MNPPTLPNAEPQEPDEKQSERQRSGVTRQPAASATGSAAVDLKRDRRIGGERVFRLLTTGSGVAVLVIIVAIGYFLVSKAIPALRANTSNFLTEKDWTTTTPPAFGIAALATGTLITAALALVIAVPIALGIALCL